MKIKLLLIIAAIFASFGQQVSAQNLSFSNLYKQNNLDENYSIFLHVNKSYFIAGETVYFQLYAINRKTERPVVDENFYISLFSSEGNLVQSYLVELKAGVGNGQMALPESLASGTYLFKSFSPWMKNFGEDNFNIQRIKVFNTSIPAKKPNATTVEISFYPESGQLISGISNRLVVIATDNNGQALKIRGEIRNRAEQNILDFQTDEKGIGTIEFTPEPDEYYLAEADYGGENLKISLPEIKDSGWVIKTHSELTKSTITIQTNQKTTEQNQGSLYLMVHRDGMIGSISEVELLNSKTSSEFVFDSGELLQGVNIVTLFSSDYKPLAERVFFNFPDNRFMVKSEITKLGEDNDSIQYQLQIKNKNNFPFASKASVSILSSQSVGLSSDNDIYSSFWLSPYLGKSIPDLSYYFKNFPVVNNKDISELDLLLMALGSNPYNWEDILENKYVSRNYAHDKGLKVLGEIVKDDNSHQVKSLIISTESRGLLYEAKKNDDNSFEFERVYLDQSEPFRLSFIGARGILSLDYGNKSNQKIAVSINPFQFKDSLNASCCNFLSVSNDTAELVAPQVNMLNEVVLEASKKSITAKTKEEEPIKRLKRTINVDEEIRKRHTTIGTLLSNQPGLNVRLGMRGEVLDITVQGGGRTIQLFYRPIVVLDGVIMGAPDGKGLVDYRSLDFVYVDDVDKVEVDKIGTAYGEIARGGAIIITTHKNKAIDSIKKVKKDYSGNALIGDKFIAFELLQGYSETKKFMMPVFSVSMEDELFKRWGSYDWKPNVIIDKDGKTTFKVSKQIKDDTIFNIKGLGENGEILSARLYIKQN